MHSTSRRVVGATIPFFAAAVALAACVYPEPASPARRQCFHQCARDKDACVLAATNADALQACDDESRACGHRCPE
jgi:hypothetical protein